MEGPRFRHEAVDDAHRIRVIPHDLALRIDPAGLSSRRAREIEGHEGPSVLHETVDHGARIRVITHDNDARIDPTGLSGRGTREIEGDEGKGTCRGWSADQH